MLIDDENNSTYFYLRGAADEPLYAFIEAFYAVNSEDDSEVRTTKSSMIGDMIGN